MKKKNSFLLFSLLFLLFGISQLEAQTAVKVNYYDGSSQSFSIEEAGRMYFNSSNLMINTDGTSTTTIPVSIVRSLVFTDESLATTEVSSVKDKLLLYPNPATDYIKIVTESNELLDVVIYNAQGQLVLKDKYNSGSDIDVSQLGTGVYFVKANQSNLKFIKR